MVQPSKLLDWKLDFYNPAHEKLYNAEYNPSVSQLMRILVGVGIVASAASPLVIFFLNREHAREHYLEYIGTCISLFWCLLWFILFFFKPIQNHASILSAFALGVFSVLSTVPSMITSSVEMQPFFASFYFLLEPFIRIRAKHSFFFGSCGVLCLFVGSLTMRHLPVYNRFAQALPSFIFLAISTFCGYYFEKRWKYDFYRRHLVQMETTKLKYAVARDASLLRNIFPKNLSDELEQQMANLQPRKSTLAPKPNTSSNVIVRVISNTALKLQKLTNSIGVADSYPDTESPNLNMPHSLSFKIPSFSASSKPQLRVDIPRVNSEGTPEYGVAPLPTLVIPPVVSSPRTSPASDKDDKEGILRTIASSGRPLHTPNNKAELHTFFTGNQHADGSLISLSHSYPLVTVIFADIVGFTSLSSTISAKELVTLLNRLFHKFDDIMEDLKLEKIRTIGDAYLCVGNMSIPLDNAEEAAVRAGLRMIDAVHKTKETLSLRVGIASGPLIAGVTGITKWNYDIFGKPLAHANLMETMAPPNCIAVSRKVYEIASCIPDFAFERKEADGSGHGHGGGWIDDDENECYVMSGYTQELTDVPSYASTDSEGENNLALLAQPMDFGMERQLSVTLRDLTDYTSDSSSNYSEDSEEADPTPSYSREELITEEIRVNQKWMPLGFLSQILEDEYRVKSIQAVHTYTRNLCCVFACTSFTLLVADILEAKGRGKQVSAISVAIYLFTIFTLIGYVLFARKYDYRIWATYVAVAVINIFGLNFIFVYFIDRTDTHVTWIILVNLGMCAFLRAPVVAMLVTHLFDCLVTLVIILTLHMEVAVRILMVIVVVIICYFAHRGFQRSLRKQFLATKRIKLDMHMQKITQHRAEMLIRNILPQDIIPRIHLQASAGVVDLFEEATMMFINLTNLVELTSDLDAANTFNVYNEIFTLFDEVTHSFGLEKIKTINTVYMVACSLPTPISNHVDVAVQFAAEIYRVISSYRYPQITPKNPKIPKILKFQVRIGLATGPVVAGIIGKRKYAYDCWSDTTNTASRMESNGWNGYLQLTPFFFQSFAK